MANTIGRLTLTALCKQLLFHRCNMLKSTKLCGLNFRILNRSVSMVTPTVNSRKEDCFLRRKLKYVNSNELKIGQRNFGLTTTIQNKSRFSVTYRKGDGEEITVKGNDGDSLLDIAVNNSVDLDGFGACEGTLSCSTCHLIFKDEDFKKIPDPASDEELDMLDLAYGLTDTSRLGCQVCLTKDLDGLKVHVPAEKADARAR